MRIAAFAIFLLFAVGRSGAQVEVSHTVVPIGNAADIEQMTRFCNALLKVIDTLDHNQTILLNGDIVNRGDEPGRSFMQIDTLLSMLASNERRKVIFLPGDRDWDNSGRNGWNHVVELERYVRAQGYPNVIWPLHRGCPGPERISLDLTLNLIAINTQWWNHPFDKPTPATAMCDFSDQETILEQISDAIDDAGYGNLIIAGHYPLESNGRYGGRFPWHKWLFPIPLVNTGITSYRQNVGTPVDLANERFEVYTEEVGDILREYASILYLSGHENAKEIRNSGMNVFLNSGIPERGGYIKSERSQLLKSDIPGVVLTQFDVNGNIWAADYDYGFGQMIPSSRMMIMQAPCLHPDPEIVVNERLVPCLQESYVLPEMVFEHPDSVMLSAGPEYQRSSFVEFWIGKHYRDSWTDSVMVPVLNLDSIHGGIAPFAIGGGRQTLSLKFQGDDGYGYVFRSVNKDPSKTLSFDLRNSLLSLAIRDQTTTQYPYGAVIAGSLLDNLDLLHARPSVYVMPDDPKLGPFQEDFGGMLGMLEDFPTGRQSIVNRFAEADNIRSSNSMFRELYRSTSNRIEAKEYARARVFDILVGDWARHEDNWKWAEYSSEASDLFRPIPRDRDHVFSRWDGVLPWIADREWAKPDGENFDYRVRGMRSLTWQSRHMDRLLTASLDKAAWIQAAEYISEELTDSIIAGSFESLPAGTLNEDVKDIESKLKARAEKLPDFIEDYYRIISKQVDVVGTIAEDYFQVTRLEDGRVEVRVLSTTDDGETIEHYRRMFIPDETREIRLFGLLGDDQFFIDGEARKSILVRVIPGRGADAVIDKSEVKGTRKLTHVYAREADDFVEGQSDLKRKSIPFDDAYSYQRTRFAYNTYLPFFYGFYTSDNGFQAGGSITFTRHNYNKPDFSAKHTLTALFSTLGNVYFGYSGSVRHVLGEWDLTFETVASRNRRFNFFFGPGNDTEYDEALLDSDFYTLRYTSVYGEIGLRRQFWKRSSFSVAARISANSKESGEGNILDRDDVPARFGKVPLRIGEVNWTLDIDLRDGLSLPKQGLRIFAQGKGSALLNEEGTYSSTRAMLEWHGTAHPATLSLRAGGWYQHDIPPFYDLQYLGQNSNLRGFRRNRFTADNGGVFFNVDTRIQLVNSTQTLIPFKIGLLLFYDTGRVFQSDEESSTWHHGYGFGVYGVPFRDRFVVGLSVGFSKEETGLLRFGFGTLFGD